MSIEEGLKKNGYHASTTSGYSMYPLLRDRRDNIVVRPCSGRLKKYDVPLYKRGNEYVLHRIIKVLPDGYVICGDNCINKEYNIKDENILGVLTEVYRNNKKINMDGLPYKIYVRMCRFFTLCELLTKRPFVYFPLLSTSYLKKVILHE